MSNQDTVFVAVGCTYSGIYHTQEDCNKQPENAKRINREIADAHGMRACRYCTNTRRVYKRQGKSFRQQLEAGDVDP